MYMTNILAWLYTLIPVRQWIYLVMPSLASTTVY